MNWPVRRKIRITVMLGLTETGVAFASSSFSPTFDQVAAEFRVSTEVTPLSLSIFVLGFALSPLVDHSKASCKLLFNILQIFSPVSELYGRKLFFLPAYFVFGIFLIGVATAQNL